MHTHSLGSYAHPFTACLPNCIICLLSCRYLDEALPEALRFDWRQHCRHTEPPKKGSIQSFFSQKQQPAGLAAPVSPAEVGLASATGTGGSGSSDGGGASRQQSAASLNQQQQSQLQQHQQQQRQGSGIGHKRRREEPAAAKGAKSSAGTSSGGSSTSILRFLQRPGHTQTS